jgi:putative membrane protein
LAPAPEPDDDQPSRTELAGDRTMLANERTLAAWWRTAMAGAAGALAFAKLFGDVEPAYVVRGAATLLVAFALLVLWVAYRRYRGVSRRVDAEDVDRTSNLALRGGTALLGLAAVGAGVAVWLL